MAVLSPLEIVEDEEWVVVCSQCGFSEHKVTTRPRFKCGKDGTKLMRFPAYHGKVPVEARILTLSLELKIARAEEAAASQRVRHLNQERGALLADMQR